MVTNINVMLSLGNRIKKARLEKGMTQEELAEALGLARTTVARYELGEIEPKLQNLITLSIVLGVSTDYLLGVSHSKMYMPAELSNEVWDSLNRFVADIIKEVRNEKINRIDGNDDNGC